MSQAYGLIYKWKSWGLFLVKASDPVEKDLGWWFFCFQLTGCYFWVSGSVLQDRISVCIALISRDISFTNQGGRYHLFPEDLDKAGRGRGCISSLAHELHHQPLLAPGLGCESSHPWFIRQDFRAELQITTDGGLWDFPVNPILQAPFIGSRESCHKTLHSDHNPSTQAARVAIRSIDWLLSWHEEEGCEHEEIGCT